MPQESFATLFQTTVSTSILATDTTFNLTTTAGLPASPAQFRLRLEPAGGSTTQCEIVLCQVASGTTVTTVGTRAAAQEGTNGQAWSAGSLVTQVVTAGSLLQIQRTPTNPYKMRAHNNADAGTGQRKISLQVKDYDPNNNFDNVTNFRYTVPVAGFYHIIGKVEAYSVAGGANYVGYLYKNGAEMDRTGSNPGGISSPINVVSGIYQLAVSDYIELWTSGGAAWGGAADFSALSIHLLSTV